MIAYGRIGRREINEMADGSENSPETQGNLFARFASLGIAAPTVPYPAHTTIEEGKRLRGRMTGTFTKNLLLKDKKGRLFLLAIHEDRELDLKTCIPFLAPMVVLASRPVSGWWQCWASRPARLPRSASSTIEMDW